MTTIHSTVQQFILDAFIYDPETRERLTDDLPLIDEGILDSFGVHEALMFLEDEFHIEIKDDEVVSRNLGSIAAITAFVESKRQQL